MKTVITLLDDDETVVTLTAFEIAVLARAAALVVENVTPLHVAKRRALDSAGLKLLAVGATLPDFEALIT